MFLGSSIQVLYRMMIFISSIFESSASIQYIALNVPANLQMVLLILMSCHSSNSKQRTMTQEMKIGAFGLRQIYHVFGHVKAYLRQGNSDRLIRTQASV